MTLKELSKEAIELHKKQIWSLGYEIDIEDGGISCEFAEGYIEAMNKVLSLLDDYHIIPKKGAVKKTTPDIYVRAKEADMKGALSMLDEEWLQLPKSTNNYKIGKKQEAK